MEVLLDAFICLPFEVIDVKYSQDQQSLIQPMDFYLTWIKTDVNTKALYTELAILLVANIQRLLKWKSCFLWGGCRRNIANK